ncbi:MAG: hypothetical protein K2N90_01655 [Lachnospiraceae bacterium]|nr:hypothetical protein [Lachnospiraceae bacterium]
MWNFGKKNNDVKGEQESSVGTVSEQSIEEMCLKIAEMISGNDRGIIAELKESYANPQAYIAKYHEHLSEDCMFDEIEMEAYVSDKWWLMTDLLEIKEYVCKRDWKDELEDFLYFLSETKRAVSENVRLDKLDLPFSEEGDIAEWSALIDKELTSKNLAVGNIDTESDEYTVFLCAVDELERLEKCAGAMNHKITFAKKA